MWTCRTPPISPAATISRASRIMGEARPRISHSEQQTTLSGAYRPDRTPPRCGWSGACHTPRASRHRENALRSRSANRFGVVTATASSPSGPHALRCRHRRGVRIDPLRIDSPLRSLAPIDLRIAREHAPPPPPTHRTLGPPQRGPGPIPPAANHPEPQEAGGSQRTRIHFSITCSRVPGGPGLQRSIRVPGSCRGK